MAERENLFYVVRRLTRDNKTWGQIVFRSESKLKCLQYKENMNHPAINLWVIPEDEMGPLELYESRMWG